MQASCPHWNKCFTCLIYCNLKHELKVSLEHSLKLLKSCQTQRDYYCQMGNTTSWQTMLMKKWGKWMPATLIKTRSKCCRPVRLFGVFQANVFLVGENPSQYTYICWMHIFFFLYQENWNSDKLMFGGLFIFQSGRIIQNIIAGADADWVCLEGARSHNGQELKIYLLLPLLRATRLDIRFC